MSQPLYKIIPIAVLALVVFSFRLTDLINKRPHPLLYVVLGEVYVAMFLAYVMKAGPAAVCSVMLAGITASFIGDDEEHPSPLKVLLLSTGAFAAIIKLTESIDPEHLHQLLLLLWFRHGFTSTMFRELIWICYFAMAWGLAVLLRTCVFRFTSPGRATPPSAPRA